MRIIIDLPDYDDNSLDVIWEDGSTYCLQSNDSSATLIANKEGLISFAKQMLYLAYNNLPDGSHIHYDEFFTKNPKFEFTIKKIGDGSLIDKK